MLKFLIEWELVHYHYCCHLAYQVVQVTARWMNTRFSTHKGFLIQWSHLQKGIWTGCPDAPSDGFVSHGEKEEYKSVGLLLGIKRLPRGPFLLRAKVYIYSCRGTVPLINGEEIFYVVMMTIGVSRSIITLRTTVRNHGRLRDCQRSWEGDHVEWSREVTCYHFILSSHSTGDKMWAMTVCCDCV